MLTIISRKKVRFPNPSVGILNAEGEPANQKKFEELYFETKPGANGQFGDPQQAPEWIKGTRTWELYAGAGDVAEITLKATASEADKAIAAAQAQNEAVSDNLTEMNAEEEEEESEEEEKEAGEQEPVRRVKPKTKKR